MRLVPIFVLETNNQTNNECLPKFVLTDNASSSTKTANTFKSVVCIKAYGRTWLCISKILLNCFELDTHVHCSHIVDGNGLTDIYIIHTLRVSRNNIN